MWFTKNPMKKYCLAAELCCSGKVLFFEPEIWTAASQPRGAIQMHNFLKSASAELVQCILQGPGNSVKKMHLFVLWAVAVLQTL